MIEIPYSTDKAGITATAELKGFTNADTLTLGKVSHLPGTLMFVGFVAPPPVDPQPGPKRWDGVLRFETATNDQIKRKPMTKLFATHDAKQAKPKKGGDA